MGDVNNYGFLPEEKLALVRKYQACLTAGPRDLVYVKALSGKAFAELTPMEIYRVVQVYDNNHVAIEAAIAKEEA